MVNSLWPAPDLQDVQNKFDDFIRYSGVMYYTFFNLYFGIWFWVGTWIAVNHSSADNYAKSLATTGLVASLINVVTIPLLCILRHIQKADFEDTN